MCLCPYREWYTLESEGTWPCMLVSWVTPDQGLTFSDPELGGAFSGMVESDKQTVSLLPGESPVLFCHIHSYLDTTPVILSVSRGSVAVLCSHCVQHLRACEGHVCVCRCGAGGLCSGLRRICALCMCRVGSCLHLSHRFQWWGSWWMPGRAGRHRVLFREVLFPKGSSAHFYYEAFHTPSRSVG